MTNGSILPGLLAALVLSACTAQSGSDEAPVNQTALAAELLKAAGGDMRIVEASGGDVGKARLLAAGKQMAERAAEQNPQPSPAAQKAACWTPPSGPNIMDDPDRPIRFDEVQEIEAATGRSYEQGDTVWGRVEDRCPA